MITPEVIYWLKMGILVYFIVGGMMAMKAVGVINDAVEQGITEHHSLGYLFLVIHMLFCWPRAAYWMIRGGTKK